jgi:K+-sensing histidine kinase KdpD
MRMKSGSKISIIALRYAFAVVVVAIAALVQRRLGDSFGPMPLFIMFYPAILLVASICGGGPGIVATLLAALAADYWFVQPTGSLRVETTKDVLSLGIFTVANLFLCLLAERLRRARWAEALSVAQQQRAEELGRQNEELAQQSEELSRQGEELSQQTEELSGQNEELQVQSEEILALNDELHRREALVQAIMDAERPATDLWRGPADVRRSGHRGDGL